MGSKFCKVFWEWVWEKGVFDWIDIWIFFSKFDFAKLLQKKKALSKNLWLHCDVQTNLDREVTPKPHRRAVRELPTVSGKHGKIKLGRILQIPPLCKTKAGWKFHTRRIFLGFCALQARSDTPVERAKNYKPWSAHWKKQRWWFQKTVLTLNPQISTVT